MADKITIGLIIILSYASTQLSAQRLAIGEELDLAQGNNEMITNEEMKLYKIVPDERKIKNIHDLLRKHNLYNVGKSSKNKNKLKIKLNDNDHPGRKLIFNLRLTNRKREIKEDNVTKNETEPIPKEMTLIGNENNEDKYDYDEFKKEYYDEKEIQSNDTLKVKPHENTKKVEEAVKQIADVKPPANCTKNDKENYGLKAIQCLIKDVQTTGRWTDETSRRLQKLLIFWTAVYLIIVIPLWLIKGWCCCCCWCRVCKPNEIIYDAKTYIVRNPPGVFEKPNGEIVNYEPIPEEIDIFRSIELKVFSFR